MSVVIFAINYLCDIIITKSQRREEATVQQIKTSFRIQANDLVFITKAKDME